MRRLANGVYSIVSEAPAFSTVCSMGHPRVVRVDPSQREELIALAHGQPESIPAGQLFYQLQSQGLADDFLAPEDPTIMERLAELGRGFTWHIQDCPNGASLVELLRRGHSRRKLSLFEHGQTACLPEAGVARCWELTRRSGNKLNILLIGDDDLLCLALSRMGHHVTLIDIDPVLVDFIQRTAAQEKLAVDARVQDVLQPLPEDLVEAFDVVLTDPMSFETCLQAFLSRACNAVKPGGSIFTCVHPMARGVFQKVAGQLPVTVEDVLYELSTYYYVGFVENWYRSDLYQLRRVEGDPRFLPSDSIPFENIIQGILDDRYHAFTDIKGHPFRRISFEQVISAVDAWCEQMGDLAISRHQETGEQWNHLYVALNGGGHLALVFDAVRSSVSWDLYPYSQVRETALTAQFAARVPMARAIHFHRSAADVALPSVVVPPASNVNKAARKSAGKKKAAPAKKKTTSARR